MLAGMRLSTSAKLNRTEHDATRWLQGCLYGVSQDFVRSWRLYEDFILTEVYMSRPSEFRASGESEEAVWR